MAPRDRRPQRRLARIGVAAAPEQVEPGAEPLEDLRRRERRRARGRQLDRERERVEPPAQLGDLVGRLELRPLAEQRHRLGGGERRHGELDLAVDAQALAARDEDGEVRARGDERGQLGRRRDDLLEVVDEEQELGARRCARRGRCGRPRLGRSSRRRARGPGARRGRPRRRRRGSRGRARRRPRAPGESSRQPPGPVSVRSLAPPAIRASTASSSRSRPTKELAGRGRFEVASVRSGGKEPSPSWKSSTGAAMSFRRCSPSSRSGSATRAAVAAETRTCPPWPAAATRAATWTSSPT